ncbi:aspartyl-phosphate phosphatase Spo0E family protein [Fredinandcohnia quinoae]|uniref:Aspartyl-phosphate phosphatase Spo0E family protein n=1 Tax=Fredinandcohnia quinoae TaxID=2918902 RepID=A0AAW5E5E6_9BACI|nr:aspartyl-phosphate phosphatase Spo0E family protein [Fredinandcohnia sp. SECRCQ15]MCH1627568.1 aspartyl-phosphate phosphatase Spo0E family protein [Fredinandcohnia sp. SECRCQ15]
MATKCEDSIQSLLDEINERREEMITTAIKTGFTSKQTIECSQKLDQLLNQYQQFETEETVVSHFRLNIRQMILFFCGTRVKLQNY